MLPERLLHDDEQRDLGRGPSILRDGQPGAPRTGRVRRRGRRGAPVRRRGPVPRWWRDGSAAAGWLVLLGVTALWVSGGGVQELTSLSGALMSVGRLTGLVASALLLVQVFLMARVPWVEQAWGQDELARTHRLVGFTSFTLHAGPHRADHARLRRGHQRGHRRAPSSTSC